MLDKIPFNDTSRIFRKFESEITNAMVEVASSGWWLLGKHTDLFEKSFSSFCGTNYCVAVANGTDALEIALKSILIDESGPRESIEVITVANAGGYATTACRLLGVMPVYADVDPVNQLVDVNSIVNCLSHNTKVIVITHLYGAAVDVVAVRKAIDKAGYEHVSILEDCAQAHGAKVGSLRVGSMGDIATFSFYPTKNLGAMGDAGAIVTQDTKLFNKVKKLRQYGWSHKYCIEITESRNSRIDELQAAILNVTLAYLDEFNEMRKSIWGEYNKFASRKIQFLDYSDRDFVGHLAVARVEDREQFINFMQSENIAVDIHYPILDCEQPAWNNSAMKCDELTQLAQTKASTGKLVSLPLFPLMTHQEVSRVCAAIQKWELI